MKQLWGYVRTSSDKSITDSQMVALGSLTPAPHRIFIDEGISGKTMNRPEFQRLLEIAREGDEIVFYSLSRASRSTIDALNLMADLDSRGIGYRSLTESIDNTTPAGRAMTSLISTFAQFERETTALRVKAGLTAAKQRGVILGRKPVLTPQQHKFIRKLHDGGEITVTQLAEEFGVSMRTVWRSLASTTESKVAA